ncbi:hypothetical protein [Paenibacillus sp. TY11]
MADVFGGFIDTVIVGMFLADVKEKVAIALSRLEIAFDVGWY